jgi:hypothetical protein
MIGVVACGALLLGCGGGDDGPTITKAEFTKKATKVCTKTQKQMQKEIDLALKEKVKAKNASVAITAVVQGSIVPGFEKEINAIEDLGTPEGEDAQVEAVLVSMQEVVDDATTDPEAFLATAEESYEKSEKAAQDYGIPACGTPNKPEEKG